MSKSPDLERTLVIIKPDAMQRGLIGDIISRFERAGLKIIAMKMASPSESHYHAHYEEISGLISRWGQEVYETQIAQMMDSPVIAFVLEGVEVVSYVRKLVGPTDPKDALPGTIRCDFTHVTREYSNQVGNGLPTIIHASGNPEEAAQEIALWFDKTEIYPDYEVVHAPILRGKKLQKK